MSIPFDFKMDHSLHCAILWLLTVLYIACMIISFSRISFVAVIFRDHSPKILLAAYQSSEISNMKMASSNTFSMNNEKDVISIYLLNLMDNALSAASVCVFIGSITFWKSINYSLGSVGSLIFSVDEWEFIHRNIESDVLNFFSVRIMTTYALVTFTIWILFSVSVDSIVGVDFDILEQNITWEIVLFRLIVGNSIFVVLFFLVYMFDRLVWRTPSQLPQHQVSLLAAAMDIPHVDFQYHSYNMPGGSNNIEMVRAKYLNTYITLTVCILYMMLS